MKYAYYPGCSLERNASAYHDSATAIAERLGLEFEEVPDWNCCGATEYVSIDLIPAYALIARNLALAADMDGGTPKDLIAPCSACFLNLTKADHYMGESPDLSKKVNTALEAGGLHYEAGSVRVRNLLEMVVRDVGYERVHEEVTRPLYSLKVAPYFGCLTTRPGFGEVHDDPEYPTSLDKLLAALGAEVVDFPMKAHCCGGHMTQIGEETALELIRQLLSNAQDYDADVIATLCPMCQLNLDAYQESVNRHFGTHYKIPILYFTQLMGLAFDIKPSQLGIGKEFVSAKPALAKIEEEAPAVPKRKRRSREALPLPTMDKEG